VEAERSIVRPVRKTLDRSIKYEAKVLPAQPVQKRKETSMMLFFRPQIKSS
jgi:hypothetical protein